MIRILNIGIIFLICLTNKAYSQLESLKFDIEIELDYFEVKNVKDLDGTEDLCGYISCRENIFWQSDKHDLYGTCISKHYRNGTQRVDLRLKLEYNKTYEQLKDFEFLIKADLSDEEGLLLPNKFKCMDCNEESGRKLSFSEFPTTQTSIKALENNGQYQALKFGADKYFEMNFYENGNKNNGWLKFMFKVWVRPHS